MRLEALSVTRGEAWVHPVSLQMDGFDWTGCTLTAQVREHAEAKLLAVPTVTITSTSDGVMEADLNMTAQQTAVLKERCQLALQVQRTAPAFGPQSIIVACLHVEVPGVR